ncbi:MAG: M48 family metallopeptidase [Neomegalonema sp.]|nr:M48 family metallopeptidase [Neomegalonema sp.]
MSKIDGSARVSAPRHCSLAEIRRFLDQHRDWLERAVSQSCAPVFFEPGAVIPFQGQRREILHHAARRASVSVEPAALIVRGRTDRAGAILVAWLKEQAREALLARSSYHAAALGVEFSRITLRDTRSRWGSCSSRGALSYSWRLILAPREVLDYVAAHEVCHLLEMNHSPRFWAHVARRQPDWQEQRNWLRLNGNDLHRYRLRGEHDEAS